MGMCQYESFKSMQDAYAPCRRICLALAMVVILNDGQTINLFQIGRSKITRLFAESLFWTEKRGPWKEMDDVLSIAPAWRRSMTNSSSVEVDTWKKGRSGGGGEIHCQVTPSFMVLKAQASLDQKRGNSQPPANPD